MGRLRAFVESLTNKPLTVLLSHGHIDHAPGAVEFEDVYLNSADWPLYRSQCGLAGRQDYLKGNLKDRYEALTAGTLLEGDPDKTFAELTGGMVFDLGGVHLRAVAFPGHTPGSMAFFGWRRTASSSPATPATTLPSCSWISPTRWRPTGIQWPGCGTSWPASLTGCLSPTMAPSSPPAC